MTRPKSTFARWISSLLALTLWTAACLPPAARAPQRPLPSGGWPLQTLRALDAVDPIPPQADLTALYISRSRNEIRIRLDLLDFQSEHQADLLIRIRDNGNFQADPLEILVPANGITRLLPRTVCVARIEPRTWRDPLRDIVVIALPATPLGNRLWITAQTLLPESGAPLDEIAASSESPPPREQAAWLPVFWNSLPAVTPARALRSWDGAHSGPRGERHGLRHLLQAAQATGAPLVLLDLRTPRNLAALDALGGLDTIRQMTRSGQIILPETPFSSPQLAQGFDLPTSPFGYSPWQPTKPARWQFAWLKPPAPRYDGKTVWLPIPANDPDWEPTATGPALALRRALLQRLFAPQPDPLLFGGDLSISNWGTEGYAQATFVWLTARPYLPASTTVDLQTLPAAGGPTPALPPAPPIENDWPPLVVLAASALLEPDGLPTIWEENAARQAAVLEQASRWAHAPQRVASGCSDLCLLASDRLFAIIEPSSAALLYLFARTPQGIEQIIGHPNQLAAPLGDPSDWNNQNGWLADPAAPPAFAAGFGWQVAAQHPAELRLTRGTESRTYRLDENGLRLTVNSAAPLSIPILLSPWEMDASGWDASWKVTPLTNGWQIENAALGIRAAAGGRLEAASWLDALPLLRQREDPNRPYPAGAYLPWPLIQLQWQPAAPDTLVIEIFQK